MNGHNFVREGVSRLPPGFRFQPTDEEIVFQYLKCKIFDLPLPATIIPELPFSKFDPWDLPGVHAGDPDEERYFFTKKEAKYQRGRRVNRATSSGYWKVTGSDKHIACPSRQNLGMQMKGLRKTFAFYRGKSPHGRRTDWFMHEYSLLLNVTCNNTNEPLIINSFIRHESSEGIPSADWVICCVFLKQRMYKDNDATLSSSSEHNYGLTLKVDEMQLFNTSMDNRSPINNNNTMSYFSSSSSSNSITGNSFNYEFENGEETSSSP